jgi:tetratricopeptide (TPR) repeat protein
VAAAAILIACVALTNTQLKFWQNSGLLFKHAIEVNPNNYLAHFYYGRYLRQTSQCELAQKEYQDAIAIMPSMIFSYIELSDMLAAEGKTDEAMTALQQALNIRPNCSDARCNLAALLLAKKLPREEEAELAEGIKLDPTDARLHGFLGHTFAEERKYESAEKEFAEGARLAPTDPASQYQWALASAAQHRSADAIAHYRAALAVAPDLPNALNNLAWILASNPDPHLRNGPEAVQLALRACALTQTNDPIKIETLANALAESGRFEEAAAWAQKAHDVALVHKQTGIADQNLELKILFQSRRAYYDYQ